VERAIREMRLPLLVTREVDEADAVLLLKAYTKSARRVFDDARERGIPVLVVKSNTLVQVQKALRDVVRAEANRFDDEDEALREADLGIRTAIEESRPVELQPRSSALRRLQHERVTDSDLESTSRGNEPFRRVVIHPPHAE
jgi:hypothetical protein